MDTGSGMMAVWIDGQSTPSMRAAVNKSASTVPLSKLLIDARNVVRLNACLDEIAVYPIALPDSLIYQHFQDTLVHHRPYSGVGPSKGPPPPPAPPPPAYPTANTSAYYNAKEFPAGTVLPSPAGNNNTKYATDADDVSCVAQLHAAVAPRFNLTAVAKYHTPYNFNWMDPHYMAGATDPQFKRNNTNLTVALQTILASKWRFGPMLWSLPSGTAADPYVPSGRDAALIALANAHPEWPFNAIVPFGRVFSHNQSHPDGCYLQSAPGKFIDVDGTPVQSGRRKSLRPLRTAAAEAGAPAPLRCANVGLT
jgi:hypothetical protein